MLMIIFLNIKLKFVIAYKKKVSNLGYTFYFHISLFPPKRLSLWKKSYPSLFLKLWNFRSEKDIIWFWMNLKRMIFVIISNSIKVFCGEKDIFLILMLFLLLEI